jgi:type II secretory pathway pseudopilin PulG
LQVFRNRRPGAVSTFNLQPSTFNSSRAFTIIEVMVVVVLLALIVIALMAVFTGTQKAFRSTITQTDVLEGGRAAMDLIAGDLRQMSPSLDVSNGAVNLYVAVDSTTLLVQSLPPSGNNRTNMLEKIFILTRNNQTWTGTGYAVDTNSASSINPLYRFSISTNVGVNPAILFNIFFTNNYFAGMSHLLDGVVDFRVRAFDTAGQWMTNNYLSGSQAITNLNVYYLPPVWGETGFYMFSNTLPAAVEIQMGTLEDRTLQRASIWPNGNAAQINYLGQQAGGVHVFRQRVSIPNLDPAAYP